ncbi:MAG: hypothetical protein HRT88_23130 [Lentisphaeraceae bacterium]|nr:hypothetical protein [Lentisphaeraceae bacterium]
MSFVIFSLIAGIIAFKKINRERLLAVSAKTEAQELQRKSEETLALYLKERQLTEKQGEDIDELLAKIASSEDLRHPRKQIAILTQGLERKLSKSQERTFKTKLGLLHFVLQDFNSAGDVLSQLYDNKPTKKLLKICLKYGQLKEDGTLLSDAHLADIINYLSFGQRYMIPSLYHHHMKRSSKKMRSPLQYWPLAKAMLTMVNNYWNTDPLDRELIAVEGGFSLDLSNTRYRTFRCHSESFSHNILGPLKLRELNLSDTPLFELWQLSGLKLRTINLTGCWIREIHLENYSALKNMGLEEIIIDSSLYTNESMQSLNKRFTVVDVRSSTKTKK